MADIEGRARCNNVRFRGIEEAIKPDQLQTYIKSMCVIVVPSLTEAAWELDRVHRILRPSCFSEETPRDVISQKSQNLQQKSSGPIGLRWERIQHHNFDISISFLNHGKDEKYKKRTELVPYTAVKTQPHLATYRFTDIHLLLLWKKLDTVGIGRKAIISKIELCLLEHLLTRKQTLRSSTQALFDISSSRNFSKGEDNRNT
ncbi:Hypothetical predicted protein [Pelobates cultripes]|uniref:Uncharacterized protein n=1 Tax=Pelobates cultripes TaxID=61616 RepID=A0AAD1TM36_PELCU|nr:Hypothetical predicted protein [Pelobates cultripes]